MANVGGSCFGGAVRAEPSLYPSVSCCSETTVHVCYSWAVKSERRVIGIRPFLPTEFFVDAQLVGSYSFSFRGCSTAHNCNGLVFVV